VNDYLSRPEDIIILWESSFGELIEQHREKIEDSNLMLLLSQYDIVHIIKAINVGEPKFSDILKSTHQFSLIEPSIHTRQTETAHISQVGAYELDGEVYSVRKNRNSNSLQVWYFDPSAGKYRRPFHFGAEEALLRKLKPKFRLTLRKAEEFSIQSGFCCHCGRLLIKQSSVIRGLGPICKKYYE
jgi:hypothetical protein